MINNTKLNSLNKNSKALQNSFDIKNKYISDYTRTKLSALGYATKHQWHES